MAKDKEKDEAINTRAGLHLKYRPHRFEDICGHAGVVTALQGMIKSKDIPNAMMFVGMSGVGKTTLSRMMSRYINCKTFDACGSCDSCTYSDDDHPDYMEYNCGEVTIEVAKDIVAKSQYKPRHRLRIIMLDEAHLLPQKTMQFLLKPLEEPASSTMWILATTNPEKLPNSAAVMGRCSVYGLTAPTKEEIADRLKKICKKEKIELDDITLLEIAEVSGGHVRDSLQILDNISKYVKGLKNQPDKKTLKKQISEQALKISSKETDMVAVKALVCLHQNKLKATLATLLDTKEYVTLLNGMLMFNQYLINTEVAPSHPSIWHMPAAKALVKALNGSIDLNRCIDIQSTLVRLRDSCVSSQVNQQYIVAAELGKLVKPRKDKKSKSKSKAP